MVANPLKSEKRNGMREFSLASNEYQMLQQKYSTTPRLVLRKNPFLTKILAGQK